LYPYVKTLLGISGSAVVGGSTGNSSGKSSTIPIPHGNLRVPTSALTPANEEIRKDVLTQLRLHSDKAAIYATDAANMAKNIAAQPELTSMTMTESEELLAQLKPIEKKILVAHRLATKVTENAAHFPGNQEEIARIINKTELTHMKTNYVWSKIKFVKAQINAHDSGVPLNVTELTSQNVNNIDYGVKRSLAKKVLLTKEKYENAKTCWEYEGLIEKIGDFFWK